MSHHEFESCLDFHKCDRHGARAMRRLVVRQLLVFLLGAFVALGVSVASVASRDIATGGMLAVSPSADMSAIDCQNRGDAERCEPGMPSCALVCAGPLLSLPPERTLISALPLLRDVEELDPRLLVGTSPPPDLSPPRTADIV